MTLIYVAVLICRDGNELFVSLAVSYEDIIHNSLYSAEKDRREKEKKMVEHNH